MPHTLEYNYTLPSPTPIDPTQVAADSGMPGGVLNPWIFNTVAAPMLQQVKTEDEDMVAAQASTTSSTPATRAHLGPASRRTPSSTWLALWCLLQKRHCPSP